MSGKRGDRRGEREERREKRGESISGPKEPAPTMMDDAISVFVSFFLLFVGVLSCVLFSGESLLLGRPVLYRCTPGH